MVYHAPMGWDFCEKYSRGEENNSLMGGTIMLGECRIWKLHNIVVNLGHIVEISFNPITSFYNISMTGKRVFYI